MPLRTIAPRADVRARISTRLQEMTAAPALLEMSALGGAEADQLGLAAPHPMFNLDLKSVDSPDWLNQAKMTGWRYFVTSKDGVIATAETSSTSRNGPVVGTLTNEGPFAVGSEQALAQTEGQKDIADGNYVLGLIRVPALYLVALWFRSEQTPDVLDRFVPVDPAPPPFEANSLLNPADFVAALRKLKASREASGGTRDDTSN